MCVCGISSLCVYAWPYAWPMLRLCVLGVWSVGVLVYWCAVACDYARQTSHAAAAAAAAVPKWSNVLLLTGSNRVRVSRR